MSNASYRISMFGLAVTDDFLHRLIDQYIWIEAFVKLLDAAGFGGAARQARQPTE